MLTSRVQQLLVTAAYVAVFVLHPGGGAVRRHHEAAGSPGPNLLLVADTPAVAQALRHAASRPAGRRAGAPTPAVGEDEHVLAEVTAVAALALDNHRPAAAAPGAPGRSTRLGGLSRRELDVLALIAKGCTNHATCEQLHVEPKTVETHVRNIFGKLGLRPEAYENRRVLVALANQQAKLEQPG